MKRDNKRRKKNEVVALSAPQDEDKFMKSVERLIEGIPNEVTLDFITSKLPSTNLHILSSASPAWQQAIEDRLVYDSRLRSHSTERLVVIKLEDIDNEPGSGIVLYSLGDKTCYQLPPIPHVEGGIPNKYTIIALDGKVYVLGGKQKPDDKLGRKEVYVLDWAGQRQWNQCAGMHEARADFGCAAKDGKIYVFGGTSLGKAVLGSEVYDPRVNMWSAIRPTRCFHFNNGAGVMGEEVVVYGGLRYRKGTPTWADELRAYHPVTGKWRVLSKELLNNPDRVGRCNGIYFVAQGKFHSFSRSRIHVYDTENQTWKELHSWSGSLTPLSVLAVDSELIAVVWLREGNHLVQSEGFGSENQEIAWGKLPFTLSFGDCRSSMHLLEL